MPFLQDLPQHSKQIFITLTETRLREHLDTELLIDGYTISPQGNLYVSNTAGMVETVEVWLLQSQQNPLSTSPTVLWKCLAFTLKLKTWFCLSSTGSLVALPVAMDLLVWSFARPSGRSNLPLKNIDWDSLERELQGFDWDLAFSQLNSNQVLRSFIETCCSISQKHVPLRKVSKKDDAI